MDTLEQLTTFEDACQVLGIDPEKVIPDFSCYPEEDRKSMGALAKIVLIVKAANKLANGGKDWKADFDNKEQRKYEVWWSKEPSGFRYADFAYWRSGSCVGSRLCFVHRATGEYVARQFASIWNDYLI